MNIWRIENTRHIDMPADWVHGLWPFGHGLSYANIELKGAQMLKRDWAMGEAPRLRVQLHNPGTRDGVAMVQVYVRDVAASVTRPDRRLAAWAHVAVAAGASVEAELTLDPELLEVIDVDGQRVVEPGLFHALVGFNSQVNRLIELPFEVTG